MDISTVSFEGLSKDACALLVNMVNEIEENGQEYHILENLPCWTYDNDLSIAENLAGVMEHPDDVFYVLYGGGTVCDARADIGSDDDRILGALQSPEDAEEYDLGRLEELEEKYDRETLEEVFDVLENAEEAYFWLESPENQALFNAAVASEAKVLL